MSPRRANDAIPGFTPVDGPRDYVDEPAESLDTFDVPDAGSPSRDEEMSPRDGFDPFRASEHRPPRFSTPLIDGAAPHHTMLGTPAPSGMLRGSAQGAALGRYRAVLLATVAAAGAGGLVAVATGPALKAPPPPATAVATRPAAELALAPSGYEALAEIVRASAHAQTQHRPRVAAGYHAAFESITSRLHGFDTQITPVLAIQWRAAAYLQAQVSGRTGVAATYAEELATLALRHDSPLASAMLRDYTRRPGAHRSGPVLTQVRTLGTQPPGSLAGQQIGQYTPLSHSDGHALLDALAATAASPLRTQEPEFRSAYFAGVAGAAAHLLQSPDPAVRGAAARRYHAAEEQAGHRFLALEHRFGIPHRSALMEGPSSAAVPAPLSRRDRISPRRP